MLVDRAPGQCFRPAMLITTSSRCHLSPRAGIRLPDLIGEALPELQRPLPHRLMTDLDASGGEHLLDHAQAQGKPEVEPDGMADQFNRKAVAGIARGA